MCGSAQDAKTRTIDQLLESRRTLLDTAKSLTPRQQDEVFLGVWSAKDLLAHLVGWDLANLEAAMALLAGRTPEFYSHHDADWSTFNARLVQQHRKDDFAALVRSVEDSHRQLIVFLQGVPADEFVRDRGVRFRGHKVSLAGLLQVEANDENEHREQLTAFSSRPEL